MTGEPVAWSYTRRPQDSSRDAVRVLSGQTSTGDAVLVYDPEIDFYLSESPNTYLAAAQVVDALASRYETLATRKTVGALTLDYANRAKSMQDRAKALRLQAALRIATPFLGGQSKQALVSLGLNGDQVLPNFTIGMDDNFLVGAENPSPPATST